MSNRFDNILKQWVIAKDSSQWVLATSIGGEGSSYRRPGARMMINDLGQNYGLLSGGCLESDIMLQARRCWENARNRIVEYDMREEGDLSWQLGIGCGGKIQILLQPVCAENDYLQLDVLYRRLQQNLSSYYQQVVHEQAPENKIVEVPEESSDVFSQKVNPAPHLAVFGGGVDARPLVTMAAELGWRITLVDSRAGYARDGYFPKADQIVREKFSTLGNASWLQNIDVAAVMTHSLSMDADALALCQNSSALYVGLLGPSHRTEQVLACAGLEHSELAKPLANPVGLRLGGDLPESIALSILAEAHACLEKADARSISGLLKSQ